MANAPAVTISDVAERAGVSVGTVSNVVNRPERVTESTRVRVRDAISTLGWVPNGSAATLRAGQATLVGLIVPDIRNPFFTEVARGAEDLAAANGEAIVICNTDWLLSDERRALDALARQRVRGIIINPAGEDERYLEWLSDRGIALVLLDHRRSTGHVSSVVVDDVLGGAELELSPRGGVGIVLHHGRQPGRGRHLVTDRHVPPGEVRREQHRRPLDVDESGRADADRLDVATASELFDHCDDVVDDRSWIRRRRVASGTCENHAGIVDQSAGDLRPTDVDADRVTHAALFSPLRAS